MTDPRQVERTHRETEDRLAEFQAALQKRLESGLRINTLILAGAAMVSVAFAFNSMLILQQALDAKAMTALIADIGEQGVRLKQEANLAVTSVEALGDAAEREAVVFTGMAAPRGPLGAIRGEAERLAAGLRKSRADHSTAGESLTAIATDAAALVTALHTQSEDLSRAAKDGGELHAIRSSADELVDRVRAEIEQLEAAPLREARARADELAADLDAESATLSSWRQGETSIAHLRARADDMAAQLAAEAARFTELSRLNQKLLEDTRRLARELDATRSATEPGRRGSGRSDRPERDTPGAAEGRGPETRQNVPSENAP